MPPEKLMANLDFYRKSLDKTDTQIRKLSKEKAGLEKSLKIVINEQKRFNNKGLNEMRQVELSLFVEEANPNDSLYLAFRVQASLHVVFIRKLNPAGVTCQCHWQTFARKPQASVDFLRFSG